MAICTEKTFLDKLYKESGRPGIPVYPVRIHWVPLKYKWDKEYTFTYPPYDPLCVTNNSVQN